MWLVFLLKFIVWPLFRLERLSGEEGFRLLWVSWHQVKSHDQALDPVSAKWALGFITPQKFHCPLALTYPSTYLTRTTSGPSACGVELRPLRKLWHPQVSSPSPWHNYNARTECQGNGSSGRECSGCSRSSVPPPAPSNADPPPQEPPHPESLP